MHYLDVEQYGMAAVAEHERQVADHRLRELARAARKDAPESHRRWPWPRAVGRFRWGSRRARTA